MRAALLLMSGAIAALAMGWPLSPARGQVSGELTLTSNYLLRGFSLSRGRPAVTTALAYDATDVGYADVAAIAAGPRFVGAIADVGLARRLASGETFDVGFTGVELTSTIFGHPTRYHEAYVALISDFLSSHLRYSPDYYHPGVSTVYIDVETVLRLNRTWRMTGHVGILDYLSNSRGAAPRKKASDWRLAIAHRWRSLDFELARSAGSLRPQAYIFSVGYAF